MDESGNALNHMKNLRAHLEQVQHLLPDTRESAETTYADSQGFAAHKPHVPGLHEKLDELQAADIACLLEALPTGQRLLVWDAIKAKSGVAVLPLLPRAVRKSMFGAMSREELLDAIEQLDTHSIARLSPDLPHSVRREIFKSLTMEKREQLRLLTACEKDAVGSLMDFGMVTIRADVTVGVALRYLRHLKRHACQLDQLFVVDRDNRLTGVLTLDALLACKPDLKVAPLVRRPPLLLQVDDKTSQAALAFTRYGLLSAPVVDEENKLVGRVTARSMMNHLCSESGRGLLKQAGLRKDEDAFGSIGKSVRNRWMWLALNLCAALFASRVIGIFEHSIEKLAALAVLMPIVASMAGNSARQTAALIARLPAVQGQSGQQRQRLIAKELSVAGLNGLAAGGLAGTFAYLLYGNVPLGLVMAGAIMLSLLLGVLAAIMIPLGMLRLGKHPSGGASLLLTAITDSGSFFIFLGLATLFLLR